jgi:hypothetical protein
MKFFRWILSHLTLILVLSLVVYLYWNSDETAESAESVATKTPVPEATKPLGSIATDVQPSSEKSSQVKSLAPIVETRPVSDSHSQTDFSKRMQEYREKLRTEEQQAMDKASKTLELEFASGDEIKYPTDSDIGANVSIVNESSLLEPLKPRAKKSSLNVAKEVKSIIVSDESVSQKEDEDLEVVIRDSLATEQQAIKSKQVVKNNSATDDALTTKNIQRQIRDRQRQLQSQMVMMVPLDGLNTKAAKKSQSAKKALKEVEPVIETAEQGRLLQNARQAFEQKKYKLAEEKYVLLINQLPELPDIVGELANVYKTQNKMQQYLITNTKFVTRLVNHNRFSEAWRVVLSTDKIDKNIAQQQRNIIKRKQ